MIEAARELERDFPLLFWSTVYTAVLLLAALGLMNWDSRLVVGANPWLKPVKFGFSIITFNLTVGWLLMRLALPPLSARAIAAVVALAMFVEISAIVLQAGRGVPSHYNFTTPLNGAIFISMALAIVMNTLAIGLLCILSFWPQPQLPPALVWGIRLGILVFLLGSLQGFQIVGNQGHTVGASDGGSGLPILRWSTQAGDLRIAHFIGIHAIQLLPLLGFLLSRSDRQAGTSIVFTVFLAIVALFLWTNSQAWAGRPLIR